MTYPPQQPGQQGPNDPYGQQQQPGGYPQQQFPQGGPQQPPYAAPGGYPQQPRKRGPLPWILAGGGAVVVAVVVVLIIVLGGDGAGDSPKGTAEALAEAINDKDVSAYNELVCDESDKIDPKDVDREDFNVVNNVRVKSVGEPEGDTVTVVLTATVEGKDDDASVKLRKKDDKWCLNGSL